MAQNRIVFMVDVDNTLVENDDIQADFKADFKHHLEQEFGKRAVARR